MVAAPIQLRDYQLQAVEAVMRELLTKRSTLIVSATGTGKTTKACEVLRRHFDQGGKRALVIAHRMELVDQFAARAKAFELTVGIERASRWTTGNEQVVVASVQTLRGARLAAFAIDEFDLIIVDEGHHCIAQGYRDIFDHFSAAKILVITATPDRGDGVALGSVIDSCAFSYDVGAAVRDGHLVPARGIQVEVPGMDLSKVRQKKIIDGKPVPTPAEGWGPDTGERGPGEVRNLNETDLGKAVLAPEAVEGVVIPLLKLAENLRTVVFAVNIDHAKAITESIRAHGGSAEYVHGKMKAGDRTRVLKGHQSREYQFLVNVMVLTEGYDDPGIECVAIARPTQSRVFYAQACGRGLRLAEGKTGCLILDFVGVSCAFDLVGPDDVLAGALVEPTKIIKAKVEEPEVVPPPPPPPAAPTAIISASAAPVRITFTTKAVELIKRTGRAVKTGAKAAGSWFKRVLFGP